MILQSEKTAKTAQYHDTSALAGGSFVRCPKESTSDKSLCPKDKPLGMGFSQGREEQMGSLGKTNWEALG
jgi:hypothetical protein